MFEKYVFINQESFKATGHQNNNGIWLCDKIEVTAKDEKELEVKYRNGIGIINKIHNEYNNVNDSKPRVKADVGGVREMKTI